MANKKPTMKEVKTVIDNILIHMSSLENGIRGLDSALSSYITFNKNKDEWMAWVKENAERGADESKSNKSGDSSGGTGTGKTGDKASKKQDK